MEWWLTLSVILALLLALFMSGVHVAFAFMFLNIIGFYVWVGGLESLQLLVPSAFEGIAHFTLVTVPPCILIVLIATLSRQSVGDMLVAGIIPGFILASFYFLYFVVRAWLQPHLAPPFEDARASWAERVKALLAIAPLSILIFLVLGVI